MRKIGEEEDKKVDEAAVMSKKIHEEIAKLSLICSEYNERLLLVREIKDKFAPFAMAVSNRTSEVAFPELTSILTQEINLSFWKKKIGIEV